MGFKEKKAGKFLRQILEARQEPESDIQETVEIGFKGAGRINWSFWADAPWRIEPGNEELPFTFIIRDAETENVTVNEIEIKPPQNSQLQNVVLSLDEPITQKTWTHRHSIPLAGSFFATERYLLFEVALKYSEGPDTHREKKMCLQVFVAHDKLPLRHDAQWYYGDPHYHTIFTNDIKEFGNPILDSRKAGKCIGLDWLVTADHSVDLESGNPYWENQTSPTRWDELLNTISANSDADFRIIRGEEVYVRGKKHWFFLNDDTLHLLVFGKKLDKLIPGAWGDDGSFLKKIQLNLIGFNQDVYLHLFGKIYKLKHVLSGNSAVPELAGRSVEEQDVLAFAPHPKATAQLPGSKWEKRDLRRPIHGLQAWNSRKRFSSGHETCPYKKWNDSDSEDKWSGSPNEKGIEEWDKLLQEKVKKEMPRFILIGGTDAHGSFNFSEGWGLDWDGLKAHDNALGKVRTLIYVPDRNNGAARQVPTEEEIEEAIKKGSCVVTDGPVLNFTATNGSTIAKMGDIIHVNGDGNLNVNVQSAWTEEFGPVERIRVVCYFKKPWRRAFSRQVEVNQGEQMVIDDVPSGHGYIRIETQAHNGKDNFRCFTNPIWFKPGDTSKNRLQITFDEHNFNEVPNG